jgi:hypothetical protein
MPKTAGPRSKSSAGDIAEAGRFRPLRAPPATPLRPSFDPFRMSGHGHSRELNWISHRSPARRSVARRRSLIGADLAVRSAARSEQRSLTFARMRMSRSSAEAPARCSISDFGPCAWICPRRRLGTIQRQVQNRRTVQVFARRLSDMLVPNPPVGTGGMVPNGDAIRHLGVFREGASSLPLRVAFNLAAEQFSVDSDHPKSLVRPAAVRKGEQPVGANHV